MKPDSRRNKLIEKYTKILLEKEITEHQLSKYLRLIDVAINHLENKSDDRQKEILKNSDSN